ncbi:hypothetical protein VPH35_075882 [Triticum aestivum]
MTAVFRLGVDCTVKDRQKRPSKKMALKRLNRYGGRALFHGLPTCYPLYITSEDVGKSNEKVACELSSADELPLAEFMFREDDPGDQMGDFAFLLCLARKASGCPNQSRGRILTSTSCKRQGGGLRTSKLNARMR